MESNENRKALGVRQSHTQKITILSAEYDLLAMETLVGILDLMHVEVSPKKLEEETSLLRTAPTFYKSAPKSFLLDGSSGS